MIIPTIEQFNTWADNDRFWYVTHELEGFKCLAGTPAFMFRPEYAIRFQQDGNGNVIMAKAIPLHQGLKEYERAKIAAKAFKNVN